MRICDHCGKSHNPHTDGAGVLQGEVYGWSVVVARTTGENAPINVRTLSGDFCGPCTLTLLAKIGCAMASGCAKTS